MKKNLIKWFVAVGMVLAMLMAGNAWADGRGKGHGGHGYDHRGHGHQYAPKHVYRHHVAPPVRHHVHHYYAPPVVQHHTYYVPAPVPVYVAPAPVYVAPAPVYVAPPPPPGFSFSAIINEPGFSLGIAAGR